MCQAARRLNLKFAIFSTFSWPKVKPIIMFRRKRAVFGADGWLNLGFC